MGLVQLKVAIWGPFVLINFGVMPNDSPDLERVGNEWLGDAAEILSANGVDTSLKYVCRRTYTLECNWKVWYNILYRFYPSMIYVKIYICLI